MLTKKLLGFKNNLRLWYWFACRRIGVPGYQIHQIHLAEQGFMYIPIPKNASSSIKHLLFEIEFGRTFDYQYHQAWGYMDIHDYYNKRSGAFTSVEKLLMQSTMTRFAVVRDPVERLISCYRNRVVDLGDLEKNRSLLKSRGLPPAPDLNTFVLRLQEYRKANKFIEHHSRPQHQFLGNTLDYFDKIFPINKLEALKKMFSNHNCRSEMRAKKSGGTPFGLHDLSPEGLKVAIEFYKKDYKLLSNYYNADQIRAAYHQ